jgi:hypothetical protein
MAMGGDEASRVLTGPFDDAFAARRERTLAELQRLHAEVLELSDALGTWSGPGARRRLREAKQAEADLMRVLDFASWDEVVAYLAATQPPVSDDESIVIDLPTEHAIDDGNRVLELERALATAHAELERMHREMRHNTVDEMRALRDDLGEMRAQLEHAVAELVLLRLETFAARSRDSSRAVDC